jgi:hypothetical protein
MSEPRNRRFDPRRAMYYTVTALATIAIPIVAVALWLLVDTLLAQREIPHPRPGDNYCATVQGQWVCGVQK